jgi:hypothetical protein
MADDDDAQDLLLLVLFSPFLEIGKNERELMKILSLFVEFIFLLCPPPIFHELLFYCEYLLAPPLHPKGREERTLLCALNVIKVLSHVPYKDAVNRVAVVFVFL